MQRTLSAAVGIVLITVGWTVSAKTATDDQLRIECRKSMRRVLGPKSGQDIDSAHGTVTHLGSGKYEVILSAKTRSEFEAQVWERFRCVIEQTGTKAFRVLETEALRR